jgi:hypothetical protein
VIKTHSHSPTENPVEKQLRALLSRLFTVRGNKRWVDALPAITETLRNTYNSNLKALPSQAWTAERRKAVLGQLAVDEVGRLQKRQLRRQRAKKRRTRLRRWAWTWARASGCTWGRSARTFARR